MPETLFGLPAHPLIVHATVVLVPLGALLVLLHAVWPAARRRLGVVTPLVALVGLVQAGRRPAEFSPFQSPSSHPPAAAG